MWLELTRDDDTKELFNLALVINISERDDKEPGATLWYIGRFEDWLTIDVVETVADLKIALSAVGKPDVL